ncbi:MAG: DUF4129 domain-containing protein, partial [Euryarchaeota archaeon]|nr:DUF4129 domain-containing protein [Euryarchaeota archaeon]
TNLPPCGKVDPFDLESETRCEIVPEMNTGETLRMVGSVTNRTDDPWDADPIALQVDVDGNRQFVGAGETQFTAPPKKACSTCDAVYDYNFTWENQFSAKTYGMRVDFTSSSYYFTGNTSTLSPTGAYINVSVVGTTEFVMTSIPRLYRNTTNLVQAKLLDNSGQAVPNAPVNYTWSFDGRTGINYTDDRGFFEIPFEIEGADSLGNFTLQFEYPGSSNLKGSTVSQSIWVISRTNITVTTTSDNIRQSGDKWDFTALITDDAASGTTPTNLNGANSPNGGLVDVIFEGTDFNGVAYRQVVATIAPSAGFLTLPSQQPDNSHLCYYDGNDDGFADRDTDKNGLSREESVGCLKANISPLNPSSLKSDPAGFLPDGFGPVNVILRFEENLPNEGCSMLDPNTNIRTLGGSWDPCSSIPNSEQYRVLMTNNANGFSLIGRTSLIVDDQIVYTSEVNPATGQVEEKDMEVTGQLQDELGTNLSNRKVRVQYEMVNGDSGVQGCQEGYTDINGYFAIDCELSGVIAGKARVTVTYSAWDNENNDRYRYSNKSLQTEFEVFSNSTIAISEVGPFKSTEDKYIAPNGTEYYRLFLKESFHIDARLTQTNGQWVGGKCLNIYLDPESNVRPIATIRTSNIDGTIEWFSGDPLQNPTLKGVETTGGKTEGYRTLRVAFEPDANVPGGCDKDASSALNGSFTDVNILVRSRVDLQVKQTWSYIGDNGLFEGDIVVGEVALLRDRLDLAVENEEIIFLRQYFDNGSWVTDGDNKSKTNEQGVARFEWAFDGRSCGGKDCDGRWRIIAYYPGSTFFAPSDDDITHEIQWSEPVSLSSSTGFFTPGNTMALVILLMALVIGGALYYQRAQARRQVQALRGILTDTMLQLEASNEFIAAIFDCYKNLVRHFRKYGFMKKVYETTREFEAAVRSAFNMVPSEQLDGFLTIFEEARYSDHTIDASHRDRALQTLDVIVRTLTMSLGEGVLVKRFDDVNLYDNQVKAGEFVAADGTVRQAGIVEGEGTDFKI